MPTYDYECNDCGTIFEALHKMTETYSSGCPKCGSAKVNRIITSANGFILRGDGWARDGYCKTQGQINKVKKKLEE